MKKKTLINSLGAFAISVVLIIIAFTFADLKPFGKYGLCSGDLGTQYFIFSRMFWRNLLTGHNVHFSFASGFGQNMELVNAYYAYSPFHILYYLIKDVPTAIFVVFSLKVSLSALTFSLFLSKAMKVNDYINILFSVCYALNSFQLEYSGDYADALYMLPVVMLCLYVFVKEKKCIPLIISYVYIFVVNFYSGFVIGLFSLACLIAYDIMNKGNYIFKRMKMLMAYFICVAIAVLLSLFVLYPAIDFAISNGAALSNEFSANHLFVWDIFHYMFMGHSYETTKDYPYIYAGVLLIFLVPMYFFDKRNNIDERKISFLGILLFVLSLFVTPVYVILHAGNRPNGFTVRYAFVFVFALLILGAKELKSKEEFKKKMIAILISTASLFYILVAFINTRFWNRYAFDWSLKTFILNVIFLILVGVSLLLLKKGKIGKICLLCVTFAELTVNMYMMCNSYEAFEASGYRAWTNELEAALPTINSDERTLVKQSIGISNMSAEFGFMGTEQYSTGRKPAVSKLLNSLGISCPPPTMILSDGITPFTGMVLGVGNELTISDPFADLVEPAAYRSLKCLPIAYAVSSSIENDYEMTSDVFENCNRLANLLGGKKYRIFAKTDSFNVQLENMTIENMDGISILHSDGVNPGMAMVTVSENAVGDAYCFYRVMNFEDEARLGNESGNVYAVSEADNNQDSNGGKDVVRNAMTRMTGDNGNMWSMLYKVGKSDFSIYDIAVAYLDENELERFYEDMSSHIPESIQIEDSSLSIDININEPKEMLMITVPYDKGWRAYEDGKELVIHPILQNSFMGIELTSGAHSIQLEYKTPGITEGIVFLLAGIIMLTGLMIQLKREANSSAK